MRPLVRTLALTAALLALGASYAHAQGAASIDSAMTRDEVLQRLGAPVGERASGSRTYLFYANGCERTCGMHDLVVLDGDQVIDAIFRSPSRRYTGRSSSPRAVPPAGRGATAAGSRRGAGAARRAAPARAVLPAGTQSGGIVTGGDITGGAADAAPRAGAVGRASAGNGAATPTTGPANAGGDTRGNARQTRTLPGPVRVPTLPRDTVLPPPPGERNQRTLPGPVRVPTLPRDTSVARPDSAARARPDSTPRTGTN